MSRKRVTFETSFEMCFVHVEWGDGKTTGERTIVHNGITTRQVIRDGKWVNADPPPAKKVQSKVVRRKALPGPEAT